ncbi:hypothetical protein SR39_13595 [Methylobacterium radiotolerans]|nr:hypothetical protein SR39_13595 [Methylobacterium radiotolerans]
MTQTFPSSYANRSCDRPPVWSLFMGTVYVLQAADGVGGSSQLGTVAPAFNNHHYIASVRVSGTRQRPGSFDVVVGRFPTVDEAHAEVERGAQARHHDRAAFDALARLCDKHDETLRLSDLHSGLAA